MNRDEVIAAIEKLRKHPKADGGRDEFVRVVSGAFEKDQRERDSLNADFQRAILYLFVAVSKGTYEKHQKEFLRPNRRSVLMAAGMFIFLGLEIAIIPRVVSFFGFDTGALVLVGVIVAEFFGAIWVVTKIQPLAGLSGLGMSEQCAKCKYDLAGLDSVLGDELWVGPAVCPECGQQYPAVGI